MFFSSIGAITSNFGNAGAKIVDVPEGKYYSYFFFPFFFPSY